MAGQGVPAVGAQDDIHRANVVLQGCAVGFEVGDALGGDVELRADDMGCCAVTVELGQKQHIQKARSVLAHVGQDKVPLSGVGRGQEIPDPCGRRSGPFGRLQKAAVTAQHLVRVAARHVAERGIHHDQRQVEFQGIGYNEGDVAAHGDLRDTGGQVNLANSKFVPLIHQRIIAYPGGKVHPVYSRV